MSHTSPFRDWFNLLDAAISDKKKVTLAPEVLAWAVANLKLRPQDRRQIQSALKK
jgi:hypothetical protein